MLDYYGSIIKNRDEIILDIINHYNKYNEDNIKKIVEDLMDSKEINEEYSVSGWMIFFHKECIEKIDKEIQKRKVNKKISEKHIKCCSPDPNKMKRAELIAKRGLENNRNPLDTAGMDTDDEEWLYENSKYEEYIIDHYNEIKNI